MVNAALLVVTDVDSTLIQDEVIELLADAAGTRDQVASVTERAMRGEIDFAESLRERVATLAGLSDDIFATVVERVRVSPGAQQLIDAVHERGGIVGAVSGGFRQVLDPLAVHLGLDLWEANVLEVVDGHLTGQVLGDIVDGQRKADLLVHWASRNEVPLTHTMAVGDGANDLRMMAQAAVSVGYHPKPIVAEHADHVISVGGLDQAVAWLPAV
ncbi:phosphoserine phosphatase SerB [Pseudoclavibacter soli]|uniref:phosphoserine phosphatase SerB n=1 Tax=Pseudoclavibacter soli TaxID=452623 RepID=UPI0004065F21|nr:phosphoserine phosphatase SerB [Pseudoclavibacter soli]